MDLLTILEDVAKATVTGGLKAAMRALFSANTLFHFLQ